MHATHSGARPGGAERGLKFVHQCICTYILYIHTPYVCVFGYLRPAGKHPRTCLRTHNTCPRGSDSYGFYLIFMRTWEVNERKASTSLCGTIQRGGKSSIIGGVSVLFPFFVQTWESRRENCGRVQRWHQSNTPGWLYKAKPRRQREHKKNPPAAAARTRR